MSDINFKPVWEELLKQAKGIKGNDNKEEVNAIIRFIKSNLNSN